MTDRAILLSYQYLHKENLILIKQLLLLNNYPINLINKQIEKRFTYLNNNRDGRLSYIQESDSNKKYITIPYFGQISQKIQSILNSYNIPIIIFTSVE